MKTMSVKRKEHELTSEEEEEEEGDDMGSPLEVKQDKTLEKNFHAGPQITFAALLRRILNSQIPLSQQHPGYLLGFVNMLETEDNLPVELDNSLHGLQKAAKIWNNGIGKASKQGVIEYLQSCKGLMGTWFEMSFASTTMENIKTLLTAYNEMNITKEDCSRYVERITTSTSHTTVSSATGRAGAVGTKRQKLLGPTVDEIDVHIDEIPVEIEPSPTFKTYSSIIARKDGQVYTRRLEDKWKEFHAKVTIYRRQDLMDCTNASNKWKYKYQEVELNYNSGSQHWEMMNRIKGVQMQYLEEKNASWERKKEYNYGQ